MYPHSATPLIPTQSHTTPSLPHVSRSHTHRSPHPTLTTYPKLPPTVPTLHSSHPIPLPLLLYSNQPYPTISIVLSSLSHPQTHPIPSQPDPLPHLNPTHLPCYSHSTNYRTLQTLTPSTPICPPRRNDFHQS